MQIEYIIAGCILLLGFFMPNYCYRKGLKEGYEMAKGKVPEPIKSPVKTIQNTLGEKKQEKEVNLFFEGLNNIMNYDGNPQKGADK